MQNVIKNVCVLLIPVLALCGCSQQGEGPDQIINHDGSLHAEILPVNPLSWKVITSFANPQAGTMATLYGNEAAVMYARSKRGEHYPPGSVLSLVTWSQKDDPHWYGARMPGKPTSLEFVFIGDVSSSDPLHYARYDGSLQLVLTDPLASKDRIAYLI